MRSVNIIFAFIVLTLFGCGQQASQTPTASAGKAAQISESNLQGSLEGQLRAKQGELQEKIADSLAKKLGKGLGLNNPEFLKRQKFSPLHVASRQGDLAKVKQLLDEKADANAKDIAGSTPLHQAAISGNADVIRALGAAQADVNAKENDGVAPLHYAARFSGETVIPVLVELKANINAEDAWGQTPLFYTCFDLSGIKGAKRAKLLIDAGADINHAAKNGLTTLHWACCYNPKVVKELLVAGANLNVRDPDGKTPLFYAVEREQIAAAKLLVDAKADLNLGDNKGWLPLEDAVDRANPDLALMLLEAGAKEPGWTEMHKAILFTGVEQVPELLKSGIKADTPDDYGRTPLFWALHFTEKEAALALIEAGANLLAKDNGKTSILHRAASAGYTDIVAKIIASGGEVNATNNDGETPLHFAAAGEAIECMTALLGKGANVNAVSRSGNTALMNAASSKNPAVIKCLLDAGADVLAVNAEGKTAIDLVGFFNNEVKQLLRTAKEIAIEKQYDRIIGAYSPDNSDAPKVESIQPTSPKLAAQRMFRALYARDKKAFLDSFAGKENEIATLDAIYDAFQSFIAFRGDLIRAYGADAYLNFSRMTVDDALWTIDMPMTDESQLENLEYEIDGDKASCNVLPGFAKCGAVNFVKKDSQWLIDARFLSPPASPDSQLQLAKILRRVLEKGRQMIGKDGANVMNIKEAMFAELPKN